MKKRWLSILCVYPLLVACSPTPQPTPSPTPTPAPQVASISGSLKISGPVVQNTTALFLQRQVGQSRYTAFDRQPAANNLSWSLADAKIGTPYEITATLQVNEQDAATGNVLTTTPPATGQTILINTNLNLPAPSEKPMVTCGEPDNTNGFNATITYPRISNAAGYFYQVGSQPGTDDIKKGGVKASPTDLASTQVYIKQGQTNYTRYAYTRCTDCDVYDTQNWSAWSPTTGFQCPQ